MIEVQRRRERPLDLGASFRGLLLNEPLVGRHLLIGIGHCIAIREVLGIKIFAQRAMADQFGSNKILIAQAQCRERTIDIASR